MDDTLIRRDDDMIIMEGYLTKVKTKKRKYFVLRRERTTSGSTTKSPSSTTTTTSQPFTTKSPFSTSQPFTTTKSPSTSKETPPPTPKETPPSTPTPYLDYYTDKNFFLTNPSKPRRSINLAECLGISTDLHPLILTLITPKSYKLPLSQKGKGARDEYKYPIHIYTPRDLFKVGVDDPYSRDDWFKEIVKLRNTHLHEKNIKDDFKKIWIVELQSRSTGYGDKYKPGKYHVCMGDNSIALVRINTSKTDENIRYDFALDSIMKVGDHDKFLCFETGMSCATGPGLLWFSSENHHIARNIHIHFMNLMNPSDPKKSLEKSLKKNKCHLNSTKLERLSQNKVEEKSMGTSVGSMSSTYSSDHHHSSSSSSSSSSLQNHASSPSNQYSPPVAPISEATTKDHQKPPAPPNHHSHLLQNHHPSFDPIDAGESSSGSSHSGFHHHHHHPHQQASFFADHYVQMRTSSVGNKQECLQKVREKCEDKSLSAPHLHPNDENDGLLSQGTLGAARGTSGYMDMSGRQFNRGDHQQSSKHHTTNSSSLVFSSSAPTATTSKAGNSREDIYVRLTFDKQRLPKLGIRHYILNTLKSIPRRALRSHPAKLIMISKNDDEEDSLNEFQRPRLSTIPCESIRHRSSFFDKIPRPRAFTSGQVKSKKGSKSSIDAITFEKKIEQLHIEEQQKQLEQQDEEKIYSRSFESGYEHMELGPMSRAEVAFMTKNEPYPYVHMDFSDTSATPLIVASTSTTSTTSASACGLDNDQSCDLEDVFVAPTPSHYIDMSFNLTSATPATSTTTIASTSPSPSASFSSSCPSQDASTTTLTTTPPISSSSFRHYLPMKLNLAYVNPSDNNNTNNININKEIN